MSRGFPHCNPLTIWNNEQGFPSLLTLIVNVNMKNHILLLSKIIPPLPPPPFLSLAVVPDSVVVGCSENKEYNTKPGELALRLHFEAEHSNVLIVTAELLNGCLTTCEVLAMDMTLHQYDEKTVGFCYHR